MKENKRKCFKCGSSPADDPETTLFRFPKPGSSNSLRCELWAKYCFPDKQWFNIDFQSKLYTEHRMLCHRHFKETAFVDFLSKKLRRFASPDMELEPSHAAVNLPADFAFTLDASLTKEHAMMEDLKLDKAPSVKQNKFNPKTQQVLKNKDKHTDNREVNRENGAWGGSAVRCGDTHTEIPTMNRDRGNRRLPHQNSNWRVPDSDDDDPPPQQPKRDAARQDKFRDNRLKTQEALNKIGKALFFRFGDSISAEKATDFSVQKCAAVVPVSTRAVGFYTQWVFKKVYELYGHRPDRIPECSPYAFYRVALAQFEYRLLSGKSSQINTMEIEAGLFYRPRLTIEQRDIIKAIPVTFSPLANLLAGVGSFEYKNDSYYVRCPNDRVLGILFSNLQAVVDAIANPATPHVERLSFYDLNPLPFAVWNLPKRLGARPRIDQTVVDVGHPVLLNPSDFVPPGYSIEEFEHDVHQVKNFISFVARKEINMLSEGATIDYEASGHQRILVSNDATGLRNPDRIFQGQLADEGLPQGDLESFWTPAGISSQDFFMGTINLVGERRPGVGDAFAFRSPLIAKASAKHRWTTLIDNMLG